MKTRISHYVLSIIWFWSFCLLIMRQTWVKHTHWNPAHVHLCFVSLQPLQGSFVSSPKLKIKRFTIRGLEIWSDFSSGLTRVCYRYVNTPVFLEKQFFYLKGVYCILLYKAIWSLVILVSVQRDEYLVTGLWCSTVQETRRARTSRVCNDLMYYCI